MALLPRWLVCEPGAPPTLLSSAVSRSLAMSCEMRVRLAAPMACYQAIIRERYRLATSLGNESSTRAYRGQGPTNEAVRGRGGGVGGNAGFLLVIYLLLLAVGGLAGLSLAVFGVVENSLLPATIVAGVTCLGGAGTLALRLFEFSPGWSVPVATLFAVLSAALFYALARSAQQATVRRQALSDLIGGLASVIAPIEPDRAGVIATNGASLPLTLPAISRDGTPLPVGTRVIVTALSTNTSGETAEVTPLPDNSTSATSA
jgi:membrane protein implicated in regulation of membrane protease activity